jgi:hypothetical protein
MANLPLRKIEGHLRRQRAPDRDDAPRPTRPTATMFDDALAILRGRYGDGTAIFFPELIAALEERGHRCKGEMAIAPRAYPHVLFWYGVNNAFADCHDALVRSGLVERWASPTPTMAALLHPVRLNLPLATTARIKSGKRDCWLPSGLKLVPPRLDA